MDCLDTHAPSLDCIIATLFEYPSHFHNRFYSFFPFPFEPLLPRVQFKEFNPGLI